MKKKLIIITTVLLIAIIAITSVLFVNNKKRENYRKKIAEDFAIAMQSEENMEEFVNEDLEIRYALAFDWFYNSIIGTYGGTDKIKSALETVTDKDVNYYKKIVLDDYKAFVNEKTCALKSVSKLGTMDDYKGYLKYCTATYEINGEEKGYYFVFCKDKLVFITDETTKERLEVDYSRKNALYDTEYKKTINSLINISGYEGNPVSGSKVQTLIDSITSFNVGEVGEEGLFISVLTDESVDYENKEDLESACKKAEKDNSKKNVTEANWQIKIFGAKKIDRLKYYKIIVSYKYGLINKVTIKEY